MNITGVIKNIGAIAGPTIRQSKISWEMLTITRYCSSSLSTICGTTGTNANRSLILSRRGMSTSPAKQPQRQSSQPPLSTSNTTTEQEVQKWDLFSAVVLERRPVVTQEMTPLEQEYSQLLSKYEFVLSKKNNHEIRKEKDRLIQEKIKSGELEADAASSQTAQDEEDMWAAELKEFNPASRITDADKKKDQRSLRRALDSHLLLVVEQKVGNDYKWICPHEKWQEGESMRQTTERLLKEICPDIKTKVLGNAPWGLYKYRYPKGVISGQKLPAVGAKVFFYKAEVISGSDISSPVNSKETQKNVDFKDYLWLTREELLSKLHPDYHKQLSEFLIDEVN